MSLSQTPWSIAAGTALTLAVLVGAPGAAGGSEPSRGYERQEWLRKRQQRTVAPPAPVRVAPAPPAVVTAPRPGPTLAAPVTAPTAPAVTGDAAGRPAAPAAAPVVVWYEYVPALGGWIEFRGFRVAGPPGPGR
jgi:hypothetical protein